MKKVICYLLLLLANLTTGNCNDYLKKDSLIVKQRHGRDKIYYKSCGGNDVKIIYRTDGINVLVVGYITANEKNKYKNSRYSIPLNINTKNCTKPSSSQQAVSAAIGLTVVPTSAERIITSEDSLLINYQIKIAEKTQKALKYNNTIMINLADLLYNGFGVAYYRSFPEKTQRLILHFSFSFANSPNYNYNSLRLDYSNISDFKVLSKNSDVGISICFRAGKTYQSVNYFIGPLVRLVNYKGNYNAVELNPNSTVETYSNNQYYFTLRQTVFSINNGFIIRPAQRIKIVFSTAFCLAQDNSFLNNNPELHQSKAQVTKTQTPYYNTFSDQIRNDVLFHFSIGYNF